MKNYLSFVSRRSVGFQAVVTIISSIVLLLLLYITTRLGPANNALYNLLHHPPAIISGWQIYALFFIGGIGGLILYSLIEFRQHLQHFKDEVPTIVYTPGQFARVVVVPKIRYSWKHSLASFGRLSASSMVVLATFIFAALQFVTAAPGSLTVTLNQKAGTTDPNPSYTSVFTAVFSEAIDKTTFTAPDITLGGTAPGQTVQSITEAGSFDSTTFEVRIAATAAGTIQPSIAAEAVSAIDSGSGTNQASSATDNEVTYDGSYSPDEMIIRVKTTNSGVSANNQFRVSASESGSFNYNVDCDNDGTPEFTNQTSAVYCEYGGPGEYDVSLSGTFPRFSWGTPSEANKIIDVKQWGSIQWSSAAGMFSQATELDISAIDAPNLSNVIDMQGMFHGAVSFNSSINHWDVSNVINMTNLFSHAASFNQPLGGWDVSKVGYMSTMFSEASSFDQTLGNWDVSSVTFMLGMFVNAGLSTENYDDTLIGWSQLTLKNNVNFQAGSSTYCNASAAKSHIVSTFNWTINDGGEALDCEPDVPEQRPFIMRVKTDNPGASEDDQFLIPTNTGEYTYDYNVDCNNDGTPDHTNQTGDVTCTYDSPGEYDIAISGTFPHMRDDHDDPDKILDILQWGDIQWQSMESMFARASNVQISAADVPDLSNVTNMSHMFYGATAFNSSINDWNVSSVTNMTNMFESATSFNQPLDNWNVSSVTNMTNMFLLATSFNQPLNSWDISSVTNIVGMFGQAISFNQPLNSWDVSNLTSLNSLFALATSFDQPLNSWNVSNVTDMSGTFGGATSFNQPLDNWNVSSVTNMMGMFLSASSFDQSLAAWDVSSVANAQFMFGDGTGMFAVGDLDITLTASGLSTANYDSTLIGWSALGLQSNVTFDAGTSQYCEAEAERQSITSSFNWTINDSGKNCPERPFIMQVKTDNSGTSGNDQMTIPAHPDETYNYTVDWGDGNSSVNQTGSVTHTYDSPGTYTVTIRGAFPRIHFSGNGDEEKVLSIEQWGDIAWSSMSNAFKGATNLVVNATDAPDLSNVTDMSGMFVEAASMNTDISHWDVSNVTNLSWLFAYASSFNQPLNSWDVSNVTDMSGMFKGATSFDQPLDQWDTASAADMSEMFYEASSFNQPLNSWDVSNVTDMFAMFAYALSFNQPLNNWDTDSVTVIGGMFYDASAFDQPLGFWNVSNVTSAYQMFSNASGLSTANYDDTLIGWEAQTLQNNVDFDAGLSTYCDAAVQRQSIIDTFTWTINDSGENCPARPFIIKVKTDNPGVSADNEFAVPVYIGVGAPAYDFDVDCNNDGTPEISNHNGSENPVCSYPSAGEYEIAIAGAFPRIYFNNEGDKDKLIDIMQWGDIVWHDMGAAFYGASNMTMSATDAPDLSWGTGFSLWGTFRDATSFNSDISHWNVSDVTSFEHMFNGATSFNQPLNNWDMSSATHLSAMFNNATSFNQPLNSWDTSGVVKMPGMFQGATSFSQEIDSWDVSNVTDMIWIFYGATSFNQPLNNWDVSNVTSFEHMFNGATSFNQPLNNWDTSNVTNMSGMFMEAVSFNDDLTTWNTSSVTNMGDMFNTATAFNQNINGWDVSKVTDVSEMFYGAISFNQPLNSWNVSSVTEASNMFGAATSFNQPLEDWGSKTGNIESMRAMFASASSFNQDISSWDTSSTTNMMAMFAGTPFNYPVNTWDVSNVTDFSMMFGLATAFNQPLDNWDTSSATTMLGMFAGATSFDQSLALWDVSNVGNMMFMFGDASFIGAESDPSGLSTANYDDTLIGWSTQTLQPNVTFDAGLSTYCDAAVQRQSVIDTFTWTINDSGENCPPVDDPAAFIMRVKTDNSGYSSSNQFIIPTNSSDYTYDYTVDCNNDGTPEYTNQTGNVTCEYDTPGEYEIAITGTFPHMRGSGYDPQKILDVAQWGDIAWQDMSSMFSDAINLQISAVDAPDLSSVTSMTSMFARAAAFNSPIDHWDVSNVTDMQGLFSQATAFNQDISSWNVSSVTNMSGMFGGAASFNQPLNNWDVSNVTNMHGLFMAASSFDQPLDGWIVSNVTDMSYTFQSARSFNQNINNWDVSSVTNMSGMFATSKTPGSTMAFNQPLNNWDVSSVTNMSNMFHASTSFNQPLNNWDVSNVTSMHMMFGWEGLGGSVPFNQDISSWDVSNVTNMFGMFGGATSFNQPLNNWNVSNVTNMRVMFGKAYAFNQPLNNWDVSNVTDMSGMFMLATSFNQPLNNWNVSGATGEYGMMNMFLSAVDFDQNLASWNVSNVTNMQNMFGDAISLYISMYEDGLGRPYAEWTVEEKDNFFEMMTIFLGQEVNENFTPMYSGLSTANYDDTLIGWSSQTLQPNVTFDAGLSTYCDAASQRQSIIDTFTWTINDSGENCPPVDDPAAFIMRVRTDNPGGSEDNEFTIPTNTSEYTYDYTVDCDNDGTPEYTNQTGDVTCTYDSPGEYEIAITGDFPHMAHGYGGLDPEKILDVVQWGDIQWQSMQGMFRDATNMQITAADAPDLSSVTDMSSMFSGATNFNANINHWDVSSVTDMSGMFSWATSFNSSLSNWNTSSVTNMRQMFYFAEAFNQPLDNWDVSSVTNMRQMFAGASTFDQNINDWDVSNVIEMADDGSGGMFFMATSFNQPLNNWDVSNVTNLSGMFNSATSFNQPLNNWDVSNVTSIRLMFANATSFNQPLNNWDVSNVTDMFGIFMSAENFDQSLASWDVSSIEEVEVGGGLYRGMRLMFGNFDSMIEQMMGDTPYEDWPQGVKDSYGLPMSGLSTANYDDTLIGWSTQTLQPNVTFDAGLSTYCDAADQRQSIIDTFTWTINDSGENCPPVDDPAAFIMRVKTDNPGSSADNEFSLKAYHHTSEHYPNYSVDCNNDGSSEFTGQETEEVTCAYPEAGEYEIALSGDIPHLRFNVGYDPEVPNSGQEKKMTEVIQWGAIQWRSMEGMFSGASNMQVSATDTPDLSNVTSMRSMFAGASSFNSGINHWNVSNVTNMYGLFNGATSFNQPLNNWNVSNVTDMEGMFRGATSFNSDISNWNVSNVTDMSFMFADARTFNQPIGGWDTSGIIDMDAVFANATSFNQPLNNWNVSNVTTMRFMFASSKSFNQPLNNWNVSNVTDMTSMFGSTFGGNFGELDDYSIVFNQPLNNWNVSNVTDMSGMFNGAHLFNQPLNNWNVSGVTNMSGMFNDAASFNQPLNNWNVSNVTTMTSMFAGASSFNQPLNSWDVSGVTLMTRMFNAADAFDQSLANWNVENVTDMSYMFGNLNIFVESWMGDVSYELWPQYIKDMYGLPASGLSTTNYDATLIGWSAQTLQPNVTFDAGLSTYCNAEAQRASIISTHTWTINDSGKNCPPPTTPDPDPPSVDPPLPPPSEPPRIPDPEPPLPPPSEPPRTPTTPPSLTPPDLGPAIDTPDPTLPLADPITPDELGKRPLFGFVKRVSEPVARAISWAIVAMLLAIAAFYLWRAYHAARAKRLAHKAVTRLQHAKQATDAYIQIATHYLTTPAAIMSGALELLTTKQQLPAATATRIQTALADYRQTVSQLTTASTAVLAADQAAAPHVSHTVSQVRGLMKRQAVWLPLSLAATSFGLATFMFVNAGVYELASVQFGLQLLGFILFTGALIYAYYTYQTQQTAREVARYALQQEQHLIQQRADFLHQASSTLALQFEHIRSVSTDLRDLPAAKPYLGGLQLLRASSLSMAKARYFAQLPPQPPLSRLAHDIPAALTSLQPSLDAKQLTLDLQLPDHLLLPIHDTALEQLVQSLVSNAIEFSPAGSTITVTAAAAKDTIQLQVADHGPGIPKDQRERLFEPFHRTTSTETYDHAGLGLNMYINKLIVDQMDGQITVGDNPVAAGQGSGTVVTIRLPAQTPESLEPVVIQPATAGGVG